MKYGGDGTVSIKVSSSRTKSYPSGSIKIGKRKGLKDEDSLVYLAGRSLEPKKIQALNAQGIHVKYELVSSRNDNSMSNYVALYKNHSGYVNIEVEDGDVSTQKEMIDKVIKLIYQRQLINISFLPFLSSHKPDLTLVFWQ